MLASIAAQILKAFRVGEDWHQEERLKSAYSASHNQVPSLNQTVKDHKKELKTRALCHAQAGQSPNGPLAALVGELLDPFLREIDQYDRTEVKSTEELCHEVGKVNKRVAVDGPRRGPFQVDGKLIVGGKDAVAFYPNIDIETAAEEAKMEIMNSEVEIKGIDTENVALFLACSMTQEQIDLEGLSNVVHTRKHKKGARPGLTCKAITGGPKTRDSDNCWNPPARKPGSRQIKKMIGCLVKAAIKLVMQNHYYSFNNEIRKQRKGGAIGNTLTEKLGKLLLKRFDKKYKSLLRKLKIEIELYE